jgi:endo-1,4-beta-xylanase
VGRRPRLRPGPRDRQPAEQGQPQRLRAGLVEIFVDQNNGKTEAYEADDGQYRVNSRTPRPWRLASAANFVTATTSSREVPVEAAIALDAVELKIGTLIGFDVQVNNDELGNGVRSSVALWNDPTGESFRNTSRLGVLRMVRRPLRR